MGRAPIPIIELARRNDVPKRFLEQIMLDLKAGGWVNSTIGSAVAISLQEPEPDYDGEIVRHFDGYLAPIACVSVTDYKCYSQEAVCRFQHLMLKLRNMVASLMDRTTLEMLMKAPLVPDREIQDLQGLSGEGI